MLGEPVFHSSKGLTPEHLSWHPKKYMLAIGWSDGKLWQWLEARFCPRELTHISSCLKDPYLSGTTKIAASRKIPGP